MLSHTPKGEPQTKSFTVGVTAEGHTTEWTYDRDRNKGLRIAHMRGWFLPEQKEAAALREGMTNKQVRDAFTAEVRCLLDTLAAEVPELRRIAWVNPTASDESPVDWLKAGARHEPHRRLGK